MWNPKNQYTIFVQMFLGATTTSLAVVTLMTLRQNKDYDAKYDNALILYDVALILASSVGLYSLKSRK